MSLQIHKRLLRQSKPIPSLRQLLREHGCLTLERKTPAERFPQLCWIVAGQQLSNAAAASIRRRLQAAAEERGVDLFGLCAAEHHAALRGCGLSRSKIRTLLELRDAIRTDRLSLEDLSQCDAAELVTELSKLWGVRRMVRGDGGHFHLRAA